MEVLNLPDFFLFLESKVKIKEKNIDHRILFLYCADFCELIQIVRVGIISMGVEVLCVCSGVARVTGAQGQS